MSNRRTNVDPLELPQGTHRLLLHCCCAPCAGAIIEDLTNAGIDFHILFYNPNIHPREEYFRRRDELIAYAESKGLPWSSLDGDERIWFARMRGLESEPERGKRCAECFLMRFERVAAFAAEHGFDVFTTTLMSSRHKDIDQVMATGSAVADAHPGLVFWTKNWRKNAGTQRADLIAREAGFYRQSYCGCVFSKYARATRKIDDADREREIAERLLIKGV
ncbi:MAG: epoxyqueuosine reductase QueH [Pseudomonadota bacterium]|nr:epoxyqueuosine reductase QueH [Pseudomonadota bacterium]